MARPESERKQLCMVRQPQEVEEGPGGVGTALHSPDTMLPIGLVGRGACLYLTVFLLQHRTSSVECWQIWGLGEAGCVYISGWRSKHGSE